MGKRKPDWGEIEARYLAWETPADIAKDYKTTARTISQRAYKQGWGDKRLKQTTEVIEQEQDSRKAMREMVSAGVQFILTDILQGLRDGRIGATTQDGEGFSSAIYRDTWKEALKDHYRPDGEKVTVTGNGVIPVQVLFKSPDD